MYLSCMWKIGEAKPRNDLGVRNLPAFCGLGFPMDAALFHAARLNRSLKRSRVRAARSSAPEPARLWGFELLVTLGRQTRAG